MEYEVHKASGPGLFKKLLKIMAAVDAVPKLGWNAHFKYNYVREADMAAAVRSQLLEQGIAFIPSMQGVPNTQGNVTTVNMTMTFVDVETGETYTAFWCGAGQDSSEKGLYKAYTGAIKTFFQKCFLVPSESTDPEDDEPKQEGSGGRSEPPPATKATLPPAADKPKGGKPGQRQFFATLDRAIKAGVPGYRADLYQSSEARQQLRNRLLGYHVESKDLTNDQWLSCAMQIGVELSDHESGQVAKELDERWEGVDTGENRS